MRKLRILCFVFLLVVSLNSTALAAEMGDVTEPSGTTNEEQGEAKGEDQTEQEEDVRSDEQEPEVKEPEISEPEPEDQKPQPNDPSEDIKPVVSLQIDNQNIYEGMTRSYKNGYQPVVEQNRAAIVIPLLCDGRMKEDTLTASVELGTTENSPFVYRTYQKSFKLKAEPINGTKETKEIFLISFRLELQKNRQNGIYPVTIQVKGRGEDDTEIQQVFTNYVIITDGSDPNKSETPNVVVETPTSAPIVLVSGSQISTDTVKAGEDFEAVITLKNTSANKSVQNMVVTVQVPTSDLELQNDSNTFFVGKLGKEKTTDLTLRFHVRKSVAEGNYPIEIGMSYDDAKANTISSNGVFMVTVEQPLSVKLTMPPIQKEMTVGDTIPLTFQVMNLGRSGVYNVRCDVECDGLSQTKTAFLGNMESGTEGESGLNLFVSPMEGENAYGEVTGTVWLTYEDSFGREERQAFPFETEIKERPELVQPAIETEPETASQWWVSIAILSGIVLVIGCSAGAYLLGRRKTDRLGRRER